jgi:two-component system sensor histidine kinase TctE
VVLQVEDTGPGIAPAEREAVFRPFYRALGTQVDGSGLGLAIVQEVAQRHGAEVAISDARPRSDTGTAPGTLFTVRIPLTLAVLATQLPATDPALPVRPRTAPLGGSER